MHPATPPTAKKQWLDDNQYNYAIVFTFNIHLKLAEITATYYTANFLTFNKVTHRRF